MTSQPDVDQLIKKTRRYEFSDGLRDFQFAVLLGLGGVTTWLSFEPFWITFIGTTAKTFGRWAAWVGMLPVILLILIVWGMLWVMKRVRQRWLWRETGMVNASRWAVSRKVSVISVVILLGGIFAAIVMRYLGWVNETFVLRMLWAATGWSFGYTLAAVGREIGLSRYVWLGVIGGVVSTVVLILPVNFGRSALVFGTAWFILLTVSGIITLRSAVFAMKRGQ